MATEEILHRVSDYDGLETAASGSGFLCLGFLCNRKNKKQKVKLCNEEVKLIEEKIKNVYHPFEDIKMSEIYHHILSPFQDE